MPFLYSEVSLLSAHRTMITSFQFCCGTKEPRLIWLIWLLCKEEEPMNGSNNKPVACRALWGSSSIIQTVNNPHSLDNKSPGREKQIRFLPDAWESASDFLRYSFKLSVFDIDSEWDYLSIGCFFFLFTKAIRSFGIQTFFVNIRVVNISISVNTCKYLCTLKRT